MRRQRFAWFVVVVALAAPALAQPMIQPTLLGDFDYRVYPSEAEGNTGFALGRLRPGLVLAPRPWFSAVATFEFAAEHPTVLDAFMRLKATDWAEFSVGYSKPPLFASFTHESVSALAFPDRAPVVSSFGIRRDLGVDVHFTPRTMPVEGWVRVGNGTGSALGNNNALPAGYASVDWVVGRAWKGAVKDERTFGLRLGVGALVENSRDRAGIGGQTPLDFVYYRPVIVSGLRVVGEGHAVVYAGPVKVSVEGAAASEGRSKDHDGNPATPRHILDAARSYGLTTEVSWAVRGRPHEAGGAFIGDDGRVELAARYDGLWLGRGTTELTAGGSQGGAVSMKWSFFWGLKKHR